MSGSTLPPLGKEPSSTFTRVLVRQRSHSFDDKEVFGADHVAEHDTHEHDKHPLVENTPTSPASSTVENLPQISPRSPSSPNKDILLHRQSSAPIVSTSHVRMSFVRVYAGLKTFLPRNKTVAIAIFFQPIVLVYEVILLDIVEETEFCRLYVSQTEIITQMRKRNAMAEQNNIAAKRLEAKLLPPSLSPQVIISKHSRQSRATTVKKKIRRRTDSEFASQEVNRFNNNNNLQEDQLQSDAEDDIDLDSIDVHLLLNIKSMPSSFVPKIILKCLKSHRVAGVESRFRLMNDLTLNPFTTFANVPEEFKSVLPTEIDANGLIAQAKRLALVNAATSSLKYSVNSAGIHTKNAHHQLKGLNHEETLYINQNALNPNVLKWRTMWQHAINLVMQKNCISRQMRCNWGTLAAILMADKREKEAAVFATSEHRAGVGEGGFRKLKIRARRRGVLVSRESDVDDGDLPMSIEAMSQYREEMASRRMLKREKTGLDISKL